MFVIMENIMKCPVFNIQFLKSSWKPVLLTEIHENINYFKTFPLLVQRHTCTFFFYDHKMEAVQRSHIHGEMIERKQDSGKGDKANISL
jgi:hypothetical protein